MRNVSLVIASLLALSLMTACGSKTEQVTVQGQPGTPGAPGNDGSNGQDGYSIVAKSVANPGLCGDAGGTAVYLALDLNRNLQYDESDEVQTQYVSCNGAKGDTGSAGADGQDGVDGTNGTNGTNGLNGTSCTVSKVGNAATITCGTSTAVVTDGTNGTDGAKGDKGDTGNTGATGAAGTNASGIYISEVINPCGEEFANDEVLLKLSNGRILALYDGGANEDRLALLAPGNYITTDRVQNRSCSFTITSSYQVTNQVVQSPGNSGN